jgi:predicted RNA-binding Zn ribbon-like protein
MSTDGPTTTVEIDESAAHIEEAGPPGPGDPGFQHAHLAALQDGLDFINTLEFSREGDEDELKTAEDALDWLHLHDLLHRETLEELRELAEASPRLAKRVLGRIRRVRSAMRELVEATVDQRPPALDQLSEVNRALRTHYVYELVPAPDGVSLDHRHEGDAVEGALARLVESLAREVSQGHPERLRLCANDDCRWVFSDTSRTGRRKWCDMATCGNQAKVARFRERQRAAHAETAGTEHAATSGRELVN